MQSEAPVVQKMHKMRVTCYGDRPKNTSRESGEQAALRAAGVRLVVGAVFERRQGILGEDGVADIAWMEPVGRVARRLVEPRVTHQVHDEYIAAGERVDAIGDPDRDALHQALLRRWTRRDIR